MGNYGRPFKLNCAEAAAATLYICGKREAAKAIMAEFSWGEEFLSLNKQVLDLYASCKDAKEVVQKQNEWLHHVQDSKEAEDHALGQNGAYGLPGDLPPSEDEYEEYGDYESEEEVKLDKFGNFIVDKVEELALDGKDSGSAAGVT